MNSETISHFILRPARTSSASEIKAVLEKGWTCCAAVYCFDVVAHHSCHHVDLQHAMGVEWRDIHGEGNFRLIQGRLAVCWKGGIHPLIAREANALLKQEFTPTEPVQ